MGLSHRTRRSGVAAIGCAMAVGSLLASGLAAAPEAAAQSTATCHYTSREPTIAEWSSDATAVRQAQCELRNADYNYRNLSVDGSFGPNTRAAVIDFQRCVGIGVDGVIGPQTWSWLDEAVDNMARCFRQ